MLCLYWKCHLLRGTETCLFITYQKPHKKASSGFIRRWTQSLMGMAGADVTVSKPHRVWSAATSNTKANSASLDEIMKTGGWYLAATFAKCYAKEVVLGITFTDTVLGWVINDFTHFRVKSLALKSHLTSSVCMMTWHNWKLNETHL